MPPGLSVAQAASMVARSSGRVLGRELDFAAVLGCKSDRLQAGSKDQIVGLVCRIGPSYAHQCNVV